MKYRKKPIVIEAVLFSKDTYQQAKEFCPKLNTYQHPLTNELIGTIITFEGLMEVRHGDYIIRGIKGEFYPCKPDIFEISYESIES